MNLKSRLLLLLLVFVPAIYFFQTTPLTLGLDLQGGTRLILEAQDKDDYVVDQSTMQGILSVVRSRVDGLGVAEPLIQQKGLRQLVVELPGVKDPDSAIKLIGDTAFLEFVEAQILDQKLLDLPLEQRRRLIGPDVDIRINKIIGRDGTEYDQPVAIGDRALTGADLKNAGPATNETGFPVVSLQFTAEGAKKFFNLTEKQVGKHIAILLDGKIISVASVRQPIAGGAAVIEGQFTPEEIRNIVIQLKAGSLPVPVTFVSNQIVGPTLGADSIAKSKVAGMIGFAIVIAYMLLVYRLSGLVANIALVVYFLLNVSLLKLIGATLTLPGIAGIILTIGMAVDANVIIFARIRDEIQSGRSLAKSVRVGFSKGFVAILDSNITTLMAAFVLFWLGTGSIKGFAVTLSLGILVSMFTAVFVTKLLLDSVVRIWPSVSSTVFFATNERVDNV